MLDFPNIVAEWNSWHPAYEEKLRGILPEINYYFVFGNMKIGFSDMTGENNMLILQNVLTSHVYDNNSDRIMYFVLYRKVFLCDGFLMFPK
jgi:hypothetical protein